LSKNDQRLSNPIIFIGPGRSGSTIISEVILSHESLAWPSNYQEHFPGVAMVNLLRPLFDNRYWRVTGEKGQLNKVRFLNTLLPRPAEAFPFWDRVTRSEVDFSRGFLLDEIATDKEKSRIRKTVSRIVAWQGKQRFSMKITGPGRICYLQSIFPDAQFVNVVRDPIATVHSLLKVPFWKDLGMHRLWWTGAYSESEVAMFEKIKDDPVASTSFQLSKVLKTTEVEAERCDARMLTIPYEQFVENPRECIEEICKFLDLELSKHLLEKLEQTSIHDRNSANRSYDDGFKQKVMSFF
jgi:hypothetical protein